MAAELKDLTVLTHSFGVATVLAHNPRIKVIVLPGEYQASEGAMVGAQCLDFIRSFNVDWTILGASGIGVDGPSEALIECSAVYSAMAARAQQVMIAADHSKFNLIYPGQYLTWLTAWYVIGYRPSSWLAVLEPVNCVSNRTAGNCRCALASLFMCSIELPPAL